MIQFDWPWIFLLLPLPLLLRVRAYSATRSLNIPSDLQSVFSGLEEHGNRSLNRRQLSLWLAWLLTLLCLSQPWVPGDSVAQPVSGRALALTIDVSASMERRDFELDGMSSDRLSIVKAVAREFVKARKGDRVSLVIYGKEAFIASPLTFDLNSLSAILDGAGIGMAGRSTAIGDAIGLSIKTLRDDSASSKAIVLLSDGTNNSGSVEPESAAHLAQSLGIRIHTIALGSEDSDVSGYATAQSADLDEATLMAVADISGGTFFRAKDRKDLQLVYTQIDQLEQTQVAAPPVVIRHDLRFWPLLLLLMVLLVIAFMQQGQPTKANA